MAKVGGAIGVVLLGLLGQACDGRAVSGLDGAVLGDHGGWPVDLPPGRDLPRTDLPGPLAREDLVVSRLVLPDATTAATVGHDYDGDGLVDNALGSILGAFAAMGGQALNTQAVVDWVVNQGQALLLLRLQASSLINAPSAQARTWVAKHLCCTTPQDPAACAAQAKALCFSGGHAFPLDPNDLQGSKLSGKITNGSFVFGPAPMKLALPVLGSTPLLLPLKEAYLTGTYSNGTVSGGVLAGAVSQSVLKNQVVPALAQALDALINDPGTEPQVKNIVTNLFDGNQDGAITPSEVKNSTVIKTFLGGDVDVDNDGLKELSLGLGFQAVRAVILAP